MLLQRVPRIQYHLFLLALRIVFGGTSDAPSCDNADALATLFIPLEDVEWPQNDDIPILQYHDHDFEREAIDTLHGKRPWYYKYSRTEKHMLKEFNKKRIHLDRGPIRYAEASDLMDTGILQFNQVTNALIRIAKDVGNVNDQFVESFKKYRKLIMETEREMRRYEADDSEASQVLMDQVIDIVHEAFSKNILDIWSVEDVAENTLDVIDGRFSEPMWDQILCRIMVKKRGVKQAAFFKRCRLYRRETNDSLYL